MSQPNQPPYGQPGQPQQPNQYGQQYAQPGQPDQYGQQYAQPGQPDQYGQQYAQQGQSSQYGQQAAQPNQYGQQAGQPNQYGQPGQLQPQNQYSIPADASAPQAVPEAPGSLGKALLVGLLAVVLGALVWGGLAYLTERIILYVAVAIGFGISYALTIPFRKPLRKTVIVALLIPALVLTIASVELGNYLALTFMVVKEGLPFGDALKEVSLGFGDFLTSEDGIKSGLFGLLGAGLSFFNLIRS
jgi:hypothetical protein